MATLTACSLECCPGATGAMSMPTNSLTSQGRAAAAPEPVSSVMVNSGWQSINGCAPLSTTALSDASSAATPALSSRWRALIWPLSVNSGNGSKATKSPMPMPSDSQSARVVQ
ncbi:hypothetical protein D3C85_1236990 [compost metagenome]